MKVTIRPHTSTSTDNTNKSKEDSSMITLCNEYKRLGVVHVMFP